MVLGKGLVFVESDMVGIKKSADFRAVYRKRDSRANQFLVLYKKKNHFDQNRYGISVSKKVGNSVIRHRLKRQVREICRLNDDGLLCGFDFIFVLRADAKGASYQELEQSFFNLVRRHKLQKEQ